MDRLSAAPSDVSASRDEVRLEKLRCLILKPEETNIEELDRRLSSPESLAEQVGGVLSHSVAVRRMTSSHWFGVPS